MPICRQQNLCGCVAFTKVRLIVKKFGFFPNFFTME